MIRFYTPQDVLAMLAIYRPYVTDSAVSFEYEPPTADAFAARLAGFASFYPVLVCERDGQVAGYAYAHRFQERRAYDWNAELSVYVDSRYARTGVGTALYRALTALLRLQNLRTLYAVITYPNDPSVAFHRAFGFSLQYHQRGAGYKSGAWRDVVWMTLELYPAAVSPEPIRSVHALSEAEIRACLS